MKKSNSPTEKRNVRFTVGVTSSEADTLRHSFASWLTQAGEQPKNIRELLGQESLESTDIYSHLAMGHLVASLRKLPGQK